MPYDVARDFAPVTQLAAQPNALAVSNDFPAKDIPELVAFLKRKPGDTPFGTSGVGTSTHLAGTLFMQLTGTQIEHVPYRGSGQITTAMLTGELPMTFDNLSSVLPFARDGKLRILGVGSLQRSPAAPEIPAIAESVPGFESLSWHGFFAPAKVPPAIVARLHDEAVAALKSPDGVAALPGAGHHPGGQYPGRVRRLRRRRERPLGRGRPPRQYPAGLSGWPASWWRAACPRPSRRAPPANSTRCWPGTTWTRRRPSPRRASMARRAS